MYPRRQRTLQGTAARKPRNPNIEVRNRLRKGIDSLIERLKSKVPEEGQIDKVREFLEKGVENGYVNDGIIATLSNLAPEAIQRRVLMAIRRNGSNKETMDTIYGGVMARQNRRKR